MQSGWSGVRLYYGCDLKLFILVGWGQNFFNMNDQKVDIDFEENFHLFSSPKPKAHM